MKEKNVSKVKAIPLDVYNNFLGINFNKKKQILD